MMQFKKREEMTFPFFSNHSVAARARCEMTAIIKLTQSERQALLSPQTHTHTYTHTLIHKHPLSQAFTGADRVKAEHTGLTRLAVATGLDLLALEEESGISTWLQIPDVFLLVSVFTTELCFSVQTWLGQTRLVPRGVRFHFLLTPTGSSYLSFLFLA